MRYFAAALVSATALTLSACGGAAQEPAASPVQAFELAAATLDQPGSLSFTIKGKLTSKEFGKRALPINGKGVMLLGKDASWIWLDMRKMLPVIVAQEVPPGEREVVLDLLDDPDAWRAEFRTIGKTTWMRVPAFQDIFNYPKPWIRLKETKQAKTGSDIALEEAPNDPVELVPYLRAVGKVEELGRANVNGVPTTHYRSTVKLERVARYAAPGQRRRLQAKIHRAIKETGKKTAPIDIWLDDAHMLRRMRVVDTLPPAADERYPTTYKLTIDLLGYGITVDVPRPPARKVISEAELHGDAGV
jgi:hypothetical protein